MRHARKSPATRLFVCCPKCTQVRVCKRRGFSGRNRRVLYTQATKFTEVQLKMKKIVLFFCKGRSLAHRGRVADSVRGGFIVFIWLRGPVGPGLWTLGCWVLDSRLWTLGSGRGGRSDGSQGGSDMCVRDLGPRPHPFPGEPNRWKRFDSRSPSPAPQCLNGAVE